MSIEAKEELPITGNEDVVRAVHRAKLELEQMIDLTPQVMLLVDAGEGKHDGDICTIAYCHCVLPPSVYCHCTVTRH